MSDVAIRAERLGKKYRRGLPAGHDRLSETAMNIVRGAWRFATRRRPSASEPPRPAGEFWAVQDVSFDIGRGEVVGIVGRNGAGKSTLLKLLSRITEPTSGRFGLCGHVASLLEVGTGFHGELTGRENLFLGGTLLGMTRREIQKKFDEIVAFSELDAFLDTPVKRYSSGMYTRLAFAVAAHLEPEILIVDEVLAVGDAAFQKKSLGKMGEVARGGRTILYVSHNLESVRSLCSRVVHLRNGGIVDDGAPGSVLSRYQHEAAGEGAIPLAERADRTGDGRLTFTKLEWLDGGGSPVERFATGSPAAIACHFRTESKTDLRNVHLSVGIDNAAGHRVALLGTNLSGDDIGVLPKGTDRIVVRIDRLPLTPGRYGITLYCTVEGMVADWVRNAAFVEVEAGDFFGTGRLAPSGQGDCMFDHRFTIGAGG